MQINLVKTAEWLKSNLILILIIVILILLLKGCGSQKSNLELANAKLTEQAKTDKDFGKFYLDQYNATKHKEDSLKAESEELGLIVRLLEKDVLKSKLALKNAQSKTTKPIYVNELQPCNDSLQKVYAYSVFKDSLCNKTINELDSVIVGQSKIIENNKQAIDLFETQKSYLLSAKEKNLMAIAVQDEIIANDKKLIRREKNKKTFWQIMAGVLGVLRIIK